MNQYEYINAANIDKEHICCAISGKEANTKKAWMKKQFALGHTFLRLNQRAKVFIEYAPCEVALTPIEAKGYMYVYCFWVSGKYKGQGHAKALLDSMEADAKARGKKGVVFVCGKKKKPFLSDGDYLLKHGYAIVDEGYEDYVLLCKHFGKQEEVKFMPSVFQHDEKGFVLYYSDQCVFTSKYVALIEEAMQQEGYGLTLCKIEEAQQAKKLGVISTNYSLFYNGQFISNEIMTPVKFLTLIKQYETK